MRHLAPNQQAAADALEKIIRALALQRDLSPAEWAEVREHALAAQRAINGDVGEDSLMSAGALRGIG